MKDIAVITVTRTRPKLLHRAILSVQKQACISRIMHYIIIDDCQETRDFLYKKRLNLYCNILYLGRQSFEQTGPARCAVCLNYGVSKANAKWIAFLDDDNEFEANHISSLLNCVEKHGYRAAHSYMQIFNSDGTSFVEERNPWCHDPEEAKKEYKWMLSRNVRTNGTNIVRDSINPEDHSPVDLGEWLLRRDLLVENPFETEYSDQDMSIGRHEDDILLEELIKKHEPIACSGLPTLRYYLGGYSTISGYENPFSKGAIK